jgi:hypothetical protein
MGLAVQLYRIDSIEASPETASLGRHGSFTGMVQAPMAGPSSRRARASLEFEIHPFGVEDRKHYLLSNI